MTEARDARALARRRLDKAGGDLSAARLLLAADDESLFGAVGFHAQQCAEKAIKALLTWHGVDPPHTHDLDDLCQRLPSGSDVGVSMEDLVDLNPHAVELRYSDDILAIAQSDAQRAVEVAQRVWTHVRAVVGADPP